ncbi:hypothetical protein DEU56DRAFT_916774 [Suillus clintonianus]|uniref:uncharacterized protein n=1 Tax=Suillus clintonianus TaxID=1904413 RepID=UPI001B87768C|nr:uncharacterized protein DEU56DRAFT_916774 [Suillus clintonianus]KAG2125046.1 hypothetical protein DEU56DRAFT_916774 [Suillus clintonianus]
MRSFATLAAVLPAVLAMPLEFTTHHQHPPSSCVIAGVAYPHPPHALVLLERRELSPPAGVSERAFIEFLVLCHQSDHSSSSPLVARQQGSSLPGDLGDLTGSNSTAGIANLVGGAPQSSSATGNQSASSSAAKPSPTPAAATSPAHSVAGSPSADSPGDTPSETPELATGPTTSGNSTGSPSAGNDAPGILPNSAGSFPSENISATTDNNASHDASASETPQPVPSTSDTPSDTATPQILTFNLDSPLGSTTLNPSSANFDDPSDGLDEPAIDVDGEPVGDEEPPMLTYDAAVSRPRGM